MERNRLLPCLYVLVIEYYLRLTQLLQGQLSSSGGYEIYPHHQRFLEQWQSAKVPPNAHVEPSAVQGLRFAPVSQPPCWSKMLQDGDRFGRHRLRALLLRAASHLREGPGCVSWWVHPVINDCPVVEVIVFDVEGCQNHGPPFGTLES